MNLVRCSKCVNLSSRPRIVLKDGVCSACRYAEERSKITEDDWKRREEEFAKICSKYKRTDGGYDCIVAASGGKDSMVVAHTMKYKYGMSVLAATFSPVGETEAGKKNIEALRAAGIDNIVMHINKKTMSKLCRETFKMWGDPFLPWVIGIYSFPLQLAKEKNIPLIIYAESGEIAYGGDSTISDSEISLDLLNKTVKTGDAKDYKQPENWVELFGVTKAEIAPFLIPKDLSGIKALYFAHWHKWGALHNLEQAKKIGFKPMKTRMLGTYQGYSSIDDTIDNLYMWLMFEKFGFARCTKDACKEIREGKLSREKAMEFVKSFDGEFPYDKRGFKEICAYLGMKSEEVWKTLEKFINPDVWKKIGDNHWINDEGVKLSLPLW